LIGGQAVNYWAEHYLADEPDLLKSAPFTSEDIDFQGNRDDVRHIAEQLKLTPVFRSWCAPKLFFGRLHSHCEDYSGKQSRRGMCGMAVTP